MICNKICTYVHCFTLSQSERVLWIYLCMHDCQDIHLFEVYIKVIAYVNWSNLNGKPETQRCQLCISPRISLLLNISIHHYAWNRYFNRIDRDYEWSESTLLWCITLEFIFFRQQTDDAFLIACEWFILSNWWWLSYYQIFRILCNCSL